MAFCTKCGKQNPDTNKFCIACGTALKASTAASAPVAKPQDTEYEKLFGASKKSNKNTWIILGIVGLLGLGAGAYFLFFNNKGNKGGDKKIASSDTTAVEPAYVQPTLDPPVDTTTTYPTVSNTVPLSPGNSNEELTITQSEVDAVAQSLRNFYDCDNAEDVPCLMGNYSFPLNRYYDFRNVSYETLHKLFTESFNEKLNYHHITIKWDQCTIQKIYDGYKAVLYADYEFVRSATPDENRSRSVQIIIHLNSSHHITSIYENK